MQPIRVFLVDDSPAFLDGATELLSGWPDVKLVGRAQSGTEAIEQHTAAGADVVLLDLFMPGVSGLEAARQIKAAAHPPRVVIMTIEDVAVYREAAVAHGADGFVAKSAMTTELLPLLQRLAG